MAQMTCGDNGAVATVGLRGADVADIIRLFDARVSAEEARAANAEGGLAGRIAALETVAVADLAITPALSEVGLSPVPVLTWRLDGPAAVASLTVNGTPVSVSATSWTAPAPVTADTAYTVTVTDPLGRVDTATVGIVFQHRVWWGVSAAASLTAADVLALAGTALTSGRARSVTLAAAGEYAYYAYPKRYGEVSTAKIYGFTVDVTYSEVTITTPAGSAEIYSVLRSPYPLTDSNITLEVS